MRRPASMALVVFAVSVGGCDGPAATAPTPSGGLVSTELLVRALEDQGLRVRPIEVMARQSHPYFSVPATRLSVSDENVYAFEYATAQAADRDAALIVPDGFSVGNTQIDWIGPPRFYKQNQLIVLYVGSNLQIVRPIENVLGAPVAGR